jgi:peroxiredoxin
MDDGGAKHLMAGLALPSIRLKATDGPAIDLAKSPGWSVVYIYPWTGRPGVPNPPAWDSIPGAHGSTPESGSFRDLYPGFRRQGARVFGLSGQSPEEQREFAGRMGLPFPLVSDARLAFADALRLPRFETGGVIYLKRLTLIVRNGTVARVFYPVGIPPAHPAEVLDALAAALENR